jgi:hypothetical protein
MANVNKVKRPPIYITLDKERQLKYTLNSFALMEDRYNSVDDALKAMEGGSVKAVRFMLWVGLIHEDKTLTEEQVGDMIELSDIEDIAQKMNEVMTVDLPDKGAATNNPNV